MDDNKYSQALKETLVLMRQQQARIEELTQISKSSKEPIAIIGMGCRFPGGANNPEQFWQLLEKGIDTSIEIPASRWDKDQFYSPIPDTPGRINTKNACLLNTTWTDFDAKFFNISDMEATYIDPQHRLLLEVSWEAIESAGITLSQLRESNSGVFIGQTTHDFSDVLARFEKVEQINPYRGIGSVSSAASGRIAYFLGLSGTAMVVNTSCSSSLVTLHMACQSLRCHELDLAIAGGVNLTLSPSLFINFSSAHMLSTEGKCKSFDQSADGYVRGEGCGIVVLKRLSDAQRNGDCILAVIQGSAINSNGAGTALIAPSGPAQERLVTQALENAQLTANDIDYVEAHGSGSALGDSIEFSALNRVFAREKREAHPLVVGSVKTNIGYLEAAGSIAGVIKIVLSLQNGLIPKLLHFKKLNPNIDLSKIPAILPLEAIPWSRSKRPRRAGISSFGFTGTNGHLILEEAPLQEVINQEGVSSNYYLFISAKTPTALQLQVKAYIDFLGSTKLNIGDICYTSQIGRTHFEQRVAVSGKDKTEILSKLKQWPNNQHETEPLISAFIHNESNDWEEANQPLEGQFKKVILPTYVFERRTYLPDSLMQAHKNHQDF